MLLFLLAYLGGVLTLLSPCILPVLPFVLTRAGLPFARAGLPMLVGMASSFALVASLAAVAGGWVVAANQTGRWLAMAVLALFGAALLWPALATRLGTPLAAVGARLAGRAQANVGGSLLLGVASGLLWAPCAGPVLGLILTGAALAGPNTQTSALLLAYAAGAATALALALRAGNAVLARRRYTLAASERVKRVLGALVLLAVGAIALGLDTGILTRLSLASTTALEERLLAVLQPEALPATARAAPSEPAAPSTQPPAMMMAPLETNSAMMMSADSLPPDSGPAMMMAGPAASPQNHTPETLPVLGSAPALAGASGWLNSAPLTLEALKGKVVLIDFWTYSCINCLRAIPYLRAWAERYHSQGLVVIGVHTPEFAFERSRANVERALAQQRIRYPVALDNDYTLWRAYQNRYWPAHYFIDAQGRLRHQHFGEGDYETSERVIQQLLAEAGETGELKGEPLAVRDTTHVAAQGAEAAPDWNNLLSPETYLGYQRAENFVSPGGFAPDAVKHYTDGAPRLNEWGLNGAWVVRAEHARLADAPGVLAMRFHARDLHMVLRAGEAAQPVRFRVMLDGQAPGAAHGADINAEGFGVVTEARLYQLIRQSGRISARRIDIEFLDAGIELYALTFG